MKRIAELLIQKGFAKRHVLDTKRGFGEFTWTRRGRMLHRYLCELFDVPAVSPSDLDGHEIMGVISLILFTTLQEPSSPGGETLDTHIIQIRGDELVLGRGRTITRIHGQQVGEGQVHTGETIYKRVP